MFIQHILTGIVKDYGMHTKMKPGRRYRQERIGAVRGIMACSMLRIILLWMYIRYQLVHCSAVNDHWKDRDDELIEVEKIVS